MSAPKCKQCGEEYFLSSPNYGHGAEWAHHCRNTGSYRHTLVQQNGPTPADSYRMAGVEPPAKRSES